MATRFRLPASGTAPASPALQSYSHSTADRVPLVTADSTALANLVLAPDGADHIAAGDTFFRQFISAPLQAQTFSSGAAFSYSVQALEANAGNNLQVQVWIGIVSNDGGTARGTIRSKVAEGNEVNTSLRNVNYSGTLSNSVTCEDGDRLVVEFSLTGTPVATGGVQGHNGTLRFGSNGGSGDLPANDTETGTGFNPWIEFTTDVVFIKGLRRCVTTQTVLASSTVGTTYTITCTDPTTGDTFAPVAVLAHWSGRATTGTGEASAMWGHGMAVSAASRRCMSWLSVHAAAAADVQLALRDDSLVVEISATPAVTGRVDIDAFLGDSFRLIVDDQFAADLVVVLEAFGGDISASVTTITSPAGTGDQDINVGLDLTGGLDDKAVILFGANPTGAINSVASTSNHGDIGVAAGDTVSQWATGFTNENGAATINTTRYMRAGECIGGFRAGGMLRASLTTWLSTGFRINWADTAINALFFALAIKGQRWYAGNEETRTDTTPEQILAKYKPLFLLAASHGTTQSASATAQDGIEHSVGVAASASSRGCIAYVDPDNLADSDIAIGTWTDRIYQNFDETNADKSTTSGIMDISSFDNNGVTFVMDDADPVATFFGYLIGADSRYAAVTMPTIASTAVLYAPTVKQNVVAATIASGSTLFAPSVSQSAGSQAVTSGTIASGNQRFAPTITVGAVAVTTGTIASGSVLNVPSVAYAVTTGTIASGNVLFAPTITVGAVAVTTGTIASGNQRFAPTITTGAVEVVGGTIASGSVLFAPTVTPVQSVTNGTIASGSVLYAPTLTVGAVEVVGGTIASGSQLFAPTVTTGTTIVGGTIASTLVMFAPTVVAEEAVTTGTIESTLILYAPTVAGGVTEPEPEPVGQGGGSTTIWRDADIERAAERLYVRKGKLKAVGKPATAKGYGTVTVPTPVVPTPPVVPPVVEQERRTGVVAAMAKPAICMADGRVLLKPQAQGQGSVGFGTEEQMAALTAAFDDPLEGWLRRELEL